MIIYYLEHQRWKVIKNSVKSLEFDDEITIKEGLKGFEGSCHAYLA